MQSKVFLFVAIQFFIYSADAQHARVKTITRLPKNINESSGLVSNGDGTLWTHNDSGDKAQIYKIDTSGKLLQTLYLQGVTAIDFEDITLDKKGNLYVCDCGNNQNQRKNLCIYIISATQLSASNDTVRPATIHFNYSDQSEFPPPKIKRNFDCEGLVLFHDSIFLFSKNRGASVYCKEYVLPATPGTFTAHLIDSVKTKRWITSAAISPDTHTLILLSENMVNLFTGFSGSHFFHGSHTIRHLPITQKEGVTFKTNTEIYLSDEVFRGFGGKLYSLSLKNIK